MIYLVILGDNIVVTDNWVGPSIHQGSMIVCVKELTDELSGVIDEFNSTDIFEQDVPSVVEYCIANNLVINESHKQQLKEFYGI